jgi:MFS family permease
VTETPGYPRAATGWYALAILCLLYITSFVDRQIVGQLAPLIQADLQIQDTAMGLLAGTSFALMYTAMGLPFGWLADRFSRRNLIALGATCWSILTVVCGMSSSFSQLFVARAGVGIGSAALSPSAYSLISDMIRPRWLPFALSIYLSSVAIGTGLAYILGGAVAAYVAEVGVVQLPWIGTVKAWQLAFFIAGVPGIPLVLLLLLTVREPRRHGLLQGAASARHDVPVSEVTRFVLARARTYGGIIGPFCLINLMSYAVFAWTPTYFIRVHGWTAAEIGLAFGTIVIVTGVGGALSGGALCTRLIGRNNPNAHIDVALYAGLCLLPLAATATLVPNGWVSLGLLAAVNFFLSTWGGTAAAGLQAITPNQMRAQISAMYLFCGNIVGLGLGPVLVGALTEYVFRDPPAVKYSMALVGGLGVPLMLWLLWLGRRPFRESLQQAQSWNRSPA